MKIPKNCAECDFNNLVSSGIVACKFRPNYHYDIPEEGKPVWCQLDNPTMQSLIKDAERWRKVVEITPKRCVPDHEICGYSNCAGLCMRIRDIITGEGEG